VRCAKIKSADRYGVNGGATMLHELATKLYRLRAINYISAPLSIQRTNCR
jgi:hypothetical protein